MFGGWGVHWGVYIFRLWWVELSFLHTWIKAFDLKLFWQKTLEVVKRAARPSIQQLQLG
jgi:hypothetical protein